MLFQSSIGLIVQNPDHTDAIRNFIRDLYLGTRIANTELSIFEVLQRHHETGWSGGGFPAAPNSVDSLVITSSEDVMLMWHTWKDELKKSRVDASSYKWQITTDLQIGNVELELAGYSQKDDVDASRAFSDAFDTWYSSLDEDNRSSMSHAQLDKLTSRAVDKSFEADNREIRDGDCVYSINDTLKAYNKLSFDLIFTKGSQVTVHSVMMFGYVTNIQFSHHKDTRSEDNKVRSNFTSGLYRMRRSLAAQYWLKTYRLLTGESALYNWFDARMAIESFVEQQLALCETYANAIYSDVALPKLMELVGTLKDVIDYRNVDLHKIMIVPSKGDGQQPDMYNIVDVELGNVYPVLSLKTPAYDTNGDDLPKTTFMVALNKTTSTYDGISFGDYPPVEFAVEIEESNLHKHGVLLNCVPHCIEQLPHVSFTSATKVEDLHPNLDIMLYIPRSSTFAYVFHQRDWIMHVERFDGKGEFYKIDTHSEECPVLLEVYGGDGVPHEYPVKNVYVRFNSK